MKLSDRQKKLIRVIKRKWLKPFAYAGIMSLLLYIIIGDIIIRKSALNTNVPNFLISSITEEFNETEYMHLLLTIQEIDTSILKNDLIKFVNSPFPSPCPKYLRLQLNRMNWEPNAFHIRVKNLFNMYEIYDRINIIDSSIEYLITEIRNGNIDTSLYSQVDLLKKNRDKIINEELGAKKYEFMKMYGGIVPSIIEYK